MGEGAKWELYVPPDLGYGERGAGSKIPPQSALVFEVELLKAKAE
jgi:FKBP-type peptidyl-prolyl cis-trans isomerase FklB